ncbi:MAG TPA: tetratricopeptide repeat protein [Ideonella sp.]|nr:tetratricopeptide repeat protein [Ideonella sp.]
MKATPQEARAERRWHAGLQAMKASQWSSAARSFQDAAQLTPRDSAVWLHLARARMQLGDLQKAIGAARQAIALQPDNALACLMCAECLVQQNRHGDAAAVFAAFPPGAPRDHEFLSAHATALLQANRPQEAIPLFIQSLTQKMDSALVHYRMGLAFKTLNREGEASICFRTAIAVDRQGDVRALALPQLLSTCTQACEWKLLADDIAALMQCVDQADEATAGNMTPFTLLALPAGAARQRRLSELYTRFHTRQLKALPAPGARRHGRVRVGYLSADFHNHATAMLITELLERRDKHRFEVFLYSHSVEDGSLIQKRVREAADHYVDVTTMTHAETAQRMRADGLDIAIDLKGHTRDTRFELLAHRPAPLQVSFLGYPGTTGAPFLDYVIGDPVVTPLSHAPHYTEHIAQLPASYQPNDNHRPLPPTPSRASLGLPEQAVVLCCFNQSYKILPEMLDLWVAILAGAPDTVLWTLSWNEHGQRNLLKELMARGVAPERVYSSPRLPPAEHIARLRSADLFLDTWPCNAHTTASEALWAGVPVLTVPGDTFASRVAASLVNACELPGLACPDAQAYVAKAIALARAPDELHALKRHLDDRRRHLPLFDTERYAHDYHALLMRMFDRHAAGLPPDHLPAQPSLQP